MLSIIAICRRRPNNSRQGASGNEVERWKTILRIERSSRRPPSCVNRRSLRTTTCVTGRWESRQTCCEQGLKSTNKSLIAVCSNVYTCARLACVGKQAFVCSVPRSVVQEIPRRRLRRRESEMSQVTASEH